MDFKFLIIFVIAIIVIFLWVFGLYISLKNKKNSVIRVYKRLQIELTKRYEIIDNIINFVKSVMCGEKSLIENSLRIKNELKSNDFSEEIIDRRISLDCELEKNIKQIISLMDKYPQLKEKTDLSDCIESYKKLTGVVENYKRIYNITAKKLRKAVYVFPTSFIARLSEIKAFDIFE